MIRASALNAAVAASIVGLLALAPAASAQSRDPAPQRSERRVASKPAKKVHRLAIQVDENKPEIMNLALNNAKNVVNHYKAKGEKVEIEIIAFGPGLHLLRDDTSPVKPRIAQIALEEPGITFHACLNTLANHQKAEKKKITLLPEAKTTPSGVVRLMELQGQGWAYLRP